MKDLCHIFPDTNVFLHFPPLKDIDWSAIADSKEVQLVVCMTVIHELDAKKSDSRLSSRAERAIKEIRDAQISGAELRRGVKLSVFNREIRATDFPDTLSADSADDRIVHLAKLYLAETSGVEVAIATGDYGMELRASAGGIEALALDSSLRLPNPQDEQTKKYRQAVSELNAIKHRLPKLTLGLALPDGPMRAPHEVTFEADGTWTPLDINAEMMKVERKHPKTSARHSPVDHLLISTAFVSKHDWLKYDTKLDEFYGEYRKHLEFVNVIEDAKSRSLWFDLWLENGGNGVATDIDVFLQFPIEIRFVAEKGSKESEALENKLEPPEAPEKPNPMDLVGLRLGHMNALSNFPIVPRLPLARRDEWAPAVTVHRREDHTYEIRVQVGKLKHGHYVRLGQFVCIFGTSEDVGPFKAECSITTSELTEKVTLQIPFITRLKGVASNE